MSYGGAGKVPEANIDKMVAELNERQATTNLFGCLAALYSLPHPTLPARHVQLPLSSTLHPNPAH